MTDLRNDDDTQEKRREAHLVSRMCWYASLALTAVGVVMSIANPEGDGPIVGFVGVVAALTIYWGKVNA